jgi:hypothetical protein
LAQIDPAEHEAAQRHDGQRHVHVEDLLHEALVGIHRRVEEGQAEAGRERHGGDERKGA